MSDGVTESEEGGYVLVIEEYGLCIRQLLKNYWAT